MLVLRAPLICAVALSLFSCAPSVQKISPTTINENYSGEAELLLPPVEGPLDSEASDQEWGDGLGGYIADELAKRLALKGYTPRQIDGYQSSPGANDEFYIDYSPQQLKSALSMEEGRVFQCRLLELRSAAFGTGTARLEARIVDLEQERVIWSGRGDVNFNRSAGASDLDVGLFISALLSDETPVVANAPLAPNLRLLTLAVYRLVKPIPDLVE